jgi:hypothetical protein
MSLYSDRVGLDFPLFYFQNSSTGVNNTGSITPTIVTGSSTAFVSTGGVSNSPYMYNASTNGEYGFQYSNSSAIFDDKVFSITGWFKVNSTDVGGGFGADYIFHAGNSSNGVFLQKNDKLYLGASFNNVYVNTSTAPSLNEWHHVAVTMDTTNLKLYLDGSLIQSVSSPASLTMDYLVKYWGRESTAGTVRRGAKGNFDEWAVFNTTLSAQTILEHNNAGFAILYVATPSTASALLVNPIVSAIANASISAPALTASAESGDHFNSTRDNFILLDGYMSTLSLEQWYRFNDPRSITNYGTGGSTGWIYKGSSTNNITSGIQGSGALRITGGSGSEVYAIGSASTSTEFTDDDFSLGFWVKKSTAESALIFQANTSYGNEYLNIEYNSSGQIKANVLLQSQYNQITTSTNFANGNWHYVALRKSGSTMEMWVDNTSIGTVSVTNSMSGLLIAIFGLGSTTVTEQMYISQFYIGTSANITSTEIANIYSSGIPTVQAGAAMADAKFSRNDSFNNYVENKSPQFYLKMDEATGVPVNTGSIGVTMTQQGTNFTQNIASPVYKSYNFSNRDTQFNGAWTSSSGTFSTNNRQTLVLYAKYGSAGLNGLAGTAAFEGGSGTGMFLQQLATGTMRLRSSNGVTTEDATTTINYADNAYHMFVAVKDGTNLILYVDGVQRAINSSATHSFSDAGQLAVGGPPGQAPSAASRNLTIDEMAVFNIAFTAQEAFEVYQAVDQEMNWTASSLMVEPAYTAGFGPTIAEPAMTASAIMPKVFPFIKPATATGLFKHPNFEAIKNTSNVAEPMLASAQEENPGFDISENNLVLHMAASALFANARVLIPGFWNASPAIANPAIMVDPAISSTLGALIKAQQMPARAILPTPPAYKLITDDIWYQKLFLQHSVVHGESGNTPGSSSAYAFLKLFDDVTSSLPGAVTSKLTNNLPFSIVIDNPDTTSTTVTFATASNEFLTATPTPVLEVGTYDDYERKAVRFRNTQFKISEDIYSAEAPYSLEFTFKSTKSNQVIAQSRQRSFLNYQSATASIGLVDGKLFATRVTQEISGKAIFAHPDNTSLVSQPSFISTAYGNKRIDDGLWHHIIVQHGFDGRVQFWIDGQLDIQFFGDSIYGRGGKLRPYIFGSNHTNSRWQSDFETSAWSYDAAFFVQSDQIIEHYTASIKYEPVAAKVATAFANMVEPVVAGNRARALMLYFWPTSAGQVTNFSYAQFTSNESANTLETIDYYTSPPQDYEGWDVFPVDITGRYVSDLVKPEAYGVENIQLTTLGGTVSQFSGPQQTLKVNKRRTFRDPLTDAPRYIDLINDIDLSKFDMIFFKNYPNDAIEKDSFTGSEIVDAYFNLRETAIFEKFVKSLRAAVDTGLSLMVANSQLALDLKIVDRVETVPDMDDNVGQGNYSDPFAPTQMFGVSEAVFLPVPPTYREPLGWEDTWKNNRTRIVNTYPGITDYPSLIKTQVAFWQSTDEFRWGGPDRPFARYENKATLSVGDEFVMSTTGTQADNNRQGYLATPFNNVKAGKIITAFANTVRRGLDEIQNPYRNYAQSIIVEPGNVLDGRQVGGKIFVNFTEEINKCHESGAIELISDYWVNYAYENGAISIEFRNELLAADYNQNETPYWSYNGMNILQQSGTEYELDTDFAKKGVQKAAVKTRKVNKNGGVSFRSVPNGSVFFSSTYSNIYPTVSFEVPSMPTRGFRWLSNREVIEGTVIRPEAFTATATMPNALGIPDRPVKIITQPMIANAIIEETRFSSGTRIILVLPATGNAEFVKPGSTIPAAPMLANAGMFANSRPSVAAEDQVVLYLMHVDPILYIREDVIK